MKRIVAAGCVVLHQLHPSVALGCGSTPDMLSSFLPVVDAIDVPLDAVLFAASNHSDVITFQLRRETRAPSDETSVAAVDAGGFRSGETNDDENDGGGATAGEILELAAPPRDGEPTTTSTTTSTMAESTATPDSAGAEPVQVPLEVTCYPATGGNLCVAKPKTLLEPGARYSWQTWTNVSGGLGLATVPQGFTTGASVADVGSPQVSVEVDDYRVFESHPCGQTSSVGMTVAATGLTTPLVVNVKGITPAYVHEPLVLTVDAAEQPFGLSSPPECFVIETFDVTGARAEVGEICPEAERPATPDVAPVASEPHAEPVLTGAAPSQSAAGELDVPAVDAGAPPPREVERRSVEPDVGNGCAVGRREVDRRVPASVWLVALALVVARRRAR